MVEVELREDSKVYLYKHNNGAPLDYWTLEFRELKRFRFLWHWAALRVSFLMTATAACFFIAADISVSY